MILCIMKDLSINHHLPIPKGVQIEQSIRSKITRGELTPGAKLPSMLKLADQLGVSLGVVKQALHTLTVEGVLRSVPKVGVFVSERRPTKDIALVLPTVELEQISRIIKGSRTDLPSGFRLIIEAAANSFDDQTDLLKHLNSYNIAGILLLAPPIKSYAEKIKKLLHRDVPCVQILHELHGLSTDSVTLDGFQMGAMAADYLIQKGHTKIGLIDTDADALTYINRNRGMDSALRKIGQTYVSMPKVINHAEQISADTPDLLGQDAALKLLDKYPDLTAVIGGNGHISIGAVKGIKKTGRNIPEDISFISMAADLPTFEHMATPLTAIDSPFENICRRAAQLLISRIENPEKEFESIQYPPTLHERESVKTINQ